MGGLRKLLICPYFGPLPEWFPLWERNIARLTDHGFDVLRVHDLEAFKWRVWDILRLDCPIEEGDGKIHDYRCAFGLLFADELDGYDFWGHTDFDCVYGRVENWVTDEFLDGLDLHSNHDTYVCGPWSLYRNIPDMNTAFQRQAGWEAILESPTSTGWVEKAYTEQIDALHNAQLIRRVYTYWQTRDLNRFNTLHWDGDRLMEGRDEVMMAHFRRTKVYPEQLR